MSWFEALTGFAERSGDEVRSKLAVAGETMTSRVNGRSFAWGRLEIPNLAELRVRLAGLPAMRGKLRVSEVVGDVQRLHADPGNAGALFQVASQFNLLEMMSPSVTPDQGVGIYENDRTQGPACAIAAGAGTIYRNYFVPVNGKIGQTAANQIDCLAELGVALGNRDGRLWEMRNGYAMPSEAGLREVAGRLAGMDEPARAALRQRLRIGVQWNTEVTLAGGGHRVSQAYCSALPVAYVRHAPELWAPFAQLVLEASYEAALCAGVLNRASTGNGTVFLTLLGGGAFGNREEWIFAALRRALLAFAESGLVVAIVSFRGSNAGVRALIDELN